MPTPHAPQAGPAAPSLSHPAPREFVPVDAPGIRRRAYETYDQYVAHQREKLTLLRERIEPSDAEYERILIPRLGRIPVVASAKGRLISCLCLGARLGGEVRAFKHHSVLAIGVDLEPGPQNPHVLPGDFHDLAFPDGVFELVFTNALDHAWDLPRVAGEAWRVMRPGGTLILELGLGRIGRYESLTADSIDAVLSALAPWFTVEHREPIRNTTSYVDWEGEQVILRRVARNTPTTPTQTASSQAPARNADSTVDFRVREARGLATDDRALTHGSFSVLERSLEEIIPADRFRGKRILEIGPKFGVHSKWIDKTLAPSELVMLELPQKQFMVDEWVGTLKHPHRVVYRSLIGGGEITTLGTFDLVLCLGVLYHTIEQFKVLRTLRSLAGPGSMMALQTGIAPGLPGAAFEFTWKEPGQTGNFMKPTLDALLRMLRMTGWNDITVYPDHRPGAGVALLTCAPTGTPLVGYDGVEFGAGRWEQA